MDGVIERKSRSEEKRDGGKEKERDLNLKTAGGSCSDKYFKGMKRVLFLIASVSNNLLLLSLMLDNERHLKISQV